MNIYYCFKLSNGEVIEQRVDLAHNIVSIPNGASEDQLYPQWTELAYKQCPNCTLSADEHQSCPLALSIHNTVQSCSQLLSHDDIELEVVTPQRRYLANTTAQKALSSYFGLVIGNCNCPHTQFFKPMARFHLPLSTNEESIFRVMATLCIGQYLELSELNPEQNKHEIDITPLSEVYDNLKIVNQEVARRLSGVSDGDAARDAVVLLNLLSYAMDGSIKSSLKTLKRYFT